jgi:hypothetical protein
MDGQRKIPDFSDDIASLLKDLEEIKTKQFIAGDSWIFYRNQTSNDIDYTVNILATNGVKVFRVQFIPDFPDLPCAANFTERKTFTVSHREQIVATQGAQHSWDLRYTALNNNFVLTSKVQVSATQPGTIIVSQIA